MRSRAWMMARGECLCMRMVLEAGGLSFRGVLRRRCWSLSSSEFLIVVYKTGRCAIQEAALPPILPFSDFS